ncbi:MAG: VOC family protein [Bacteroidota bacterium]
MDIQHLSLWTNQLAAQKAFYQDWLGMELLDATEDSFSVAVGHSVLEFRQGEEAAYYHFAFNVSPAQLASARDWLRSRVPLISDNGQEIIDFSFWNAEALYFYDPALNIVEFIARRDLDWPDGDAFDIRNIAGLSEIGLPVNQVGGEFSQLEQMAGVSRYSGDMKRFCAAGDPTGLFILVDQAQKEWYPTSSKSKPFELKAKVRTAKGTFQITLAPEGDLQIETFAS